MKLDSRGFNLISVVTALAVFSVLMATVSVMYRNMVEMSLQAEITHEADSLIRTVQDVLNSNQLCHRAIRGAGAGTMINYTPGTPYPGVPFQTLFANNGVTIPPAIVAQVNQQFSKLRITNMYFREPVLARNEGRPAVSATLINGADYRVVAGIVEIQFDYRIAAGMPNLPSGLLKPRTANVTVAISGAAGAGQIRFCYQGTLSPTLGDLCQPSPQQPTVTEEANAATFCGGYSGTCTPTWFVAGFNAQGNVICDCRITCPTIPNVVGPAVGSGKGGVGTFFASGALSGGATAGFGAAPGGVGAAAGGVGAAGPYGAGAAAGAVNSAAGAAAAAAAAAAAGIGGAGAAGASAAGAPGAGFVYAN